MKVIEVLIEYSIQSLNRPFSYLYSGDKKIDEGFRVLITHQESYLQRRLFQYSLRLKEGNHYLLLVLC